MDTRIDLRSDTVTKPSPRMREAMATAEVGDDWYGDDPTVNRLQDRAAELTGKEAAIYLPSGTMCTQVALHAFVRSGHLVACEATAHAGRTEASSAAVLSGISFRYLTAASRGMLTAGQVGRGAGARSVRRVGDRPGDDREYAPGRRRLGHRRGGGGRDRGGVRGRRGAAVPGWRADLNACAVAGVPVSAYAAPVSALMFCLSKGLGAPIGSVLAGDAEFIREARRLKILFGGAWRQAGIMAAAGLIALEEGPQRLHEDHANARALAAGVAELLPGSVDPVTIETNIVFADVSATGRSAAQWRERLAAEGVLVTMIGDRIRMLTHVDVTAGDSEAALAAWALAAKD
jgi:threonine aldolase